MLVKWVSDVLMTPKQIQYLPYQEFQKVYTFSASLYESYPFYTSIAGVVLQEILVNIQSKGTEFALEKLKETLLKTLIKRKVVFKEHETYQPS